MGPTASQLRLLLSTTILLVVLDLCCAQSPATNCQGGNATLINNVTTCVCPVEQYYKDGACQTFQPYDSNGKPIGQFYDFYFRPTYDTKNFKRKQNTQTIFFVTTIVLIFVWLFIACSIRLLPLGDGHLPGGGLVFRARWLVTRLDRRYHRKHWLDEQKVLIKRRTELGGTCSVASYIFTYGTILGLTAEEFWSNPPLVQSLVPNNGQDVSEYANYLNWTVTVVSGMSCDQLSASYSTIGTSLEERVLNGTAVGATYSCNDMPLGPQISIICPECRPVSDVYEIRFSFEDRPGVPALATGIEHQFTASENNGSISRSSTSYGSFKANGTLRGPVENVLWFRAIPRYLRDSKKTKLMQATFHQFVNGTLLTTEAEVSRSLQNTSETLSLTFLIEILSDYVVETDRNAYTFSEGLAFLASIGGMYQLGISLFYLIQLQVEIRLRWMAYDERLTAIATRVWKRRSRWKQLRQSWSFIWLMKHAHTYKTQWDEEDRLLLEQIEAERKAKEEKRRAKDEKLQARVAARERRKETYYSGFLRRRGKGIETQESSRPLMSTPSVKYMNGSMKETELPGINLDSPVDSPATSPDPPPSRGVLGRGVGSVGQGASAAGSAVASAGTAVASGASAGGAAVARAFAPVGHSVSSAAAATGQAFAPLGRSIVSGAQATGHAASAAGAATGHALAPIGQSIASGAQATGHAAASAGTAVAHGVYAGGAATGHVLAPVGRPFTSAAATLGRAASAGGSAVASGVYPGRAAGGTGPGPAGEPDIPAAGRTGHQERGHVFAPVGHAAHTAGSSVLHGVQAGGQAVGRTFAPVVAPVGHAIAPVTAAVSHAGQAVNRGMQTVVPFWPARRESAEGGAEAVPLRRSFSAQEPTSQNHNPFQGMGHAMHGAASSIGNIAHNVRPRMPHMFFSGPLPSFSSGLQKDNMGSKRQPDSENGEAEEKKKKKKSKAFTSYGSNTHYSGMVIREYRKPSWLINQDYLPAVPSLDEDEQDSDEEVDMEEVIEYMEDLYQYNMRMRQDFLAFQSMIENLVQYFRPQSDL